MTKQLSLYKCISDIYTVYINLFHIILDLVYTIVMEHETLSYKTHMKVFFKYLAQVFVKSYLRANCRYH